MKTLFTILLTVFTLNYFAQKGTIKNDTIKITYRIRPTIKKNAFIVKIKKRNLTKDTMITIGDYKWKLKYLPAYIFYSIIGQIRKHEERYYNSMDSTLDQLESGGGYHPSAHVWNEDYRPKNNYIYLAPKEKFKYKIKIILHAIPTKFYLLDRYFVVENLNHNSDTSGLVENIWLRFTKSAIIYIPIKIPKKLKIL